MARLGGRQLALGDRDLAEAIPMDKLPQSLVNVRVGDRDAALGSATLSEAVEQESAALSGRGRGTLRPSGTEPVVRIMAEAPTQGESDEVAQRLAAIVERELS